MAHVLLMNPNHNPATTMAMCQIAAVGLGPPPTPWTAPSGPDLITDPAALADAADLIASAALPLWPDGIIVSAFGDPGAARLAQRAPCPVIGIGAAAARQAAQAGQPFAVATTTPALAAPIDVLMTAHAGGFEVCRFPDQRRSGAGPRVARMGRVGFWNTGRAAWDGGASHP